MVIAIPSRLTVEGWHARPGKENRVEHAAANSELGHPPERGVPFLQQGPIDTHSQQTSASNPSQNRPCMPLITNPTNEQPRPPTTTNPFSLAVMASGRLRPMRCRGVRRS